MTKTLTAERLREHPDRPDILIQDINGEVPDHYRICHRHEFASLPTVHVEDAATCSFCEAEHDAITARVRYRALMGIVAGDSER